MEVFIAPVLVDEQLGPTIFFSCRKEVLRRLKDTHDVIFEEIHICHEAVMKDRGVALPEKEASKVVSIVELAGNRILAQELERPRRKEPGIETEARFAWARRAFVSESKILDARYE